MRAEGPRVSILGDLRTLNAQNSKTKRARRNLTEVLAESCRTEKKSLKKFENLFKTFPHIESKTWKIKTDRLILIEVLAES